MRDTGFGPDCIQAIDGNEFVVTIDNDAVRVSDRPVMVCTISVVLGYGKEAEEEGERLSKLGGFGYDVEDNHHGLWYLVYRTAWFK